MASDGYGQSHSQNPAPNSNQYAHTRPYNGSTHELSHPAAAVAAAGRADLLPPPPLRVGYGFRPASPDYIYSSRSATPRSSIESRSSTPPTHAYHGESAGSFTCVGDVKEQNKKKKRNWFGRDKNKNADDSGPPTWVVGYQDTRPFDLVGLMDAKPVPELWDLNGDCLVYLFPQASLRGPSFRIHSSILQSSSVLANFITYHGKQPPLQMDGANLAIKGPSTPPMTPQMGAPDSPDTRSSKRQPQEMHLYMPLDLCGHPALHSPGRSQPVPEDVETLVASRNLFAFLMGRSLVATKKHPSIYSIFMRLSELLKTYGFSNLDGSTFGEVASNSLDHYIDELGLADVRMSHERTVEAIVLGEHMKSIKLYNEAFTHAVGKHEDIVKLNYPKFRLISPIIVNRLSRAAMDLDKRTASVRHALEDFDFPSIFSGILGSKTADERKSVNFHTWKDSFFATRKFVIHYYKHRYGAWPPKAKSKKNDLETSGLNRSVLRELYQDLGCMYDLLADRKKLTNRTADGVLNDDGDVAVPRIRALYQVLSEYDRSSPPVKPPIPFDVPIGPSLKATRPNFSTSDTKAKAKKLKDEEIAKILDASHNQDVKPTLFVEAFMEMERKAAHSCNIEQIGELRVGQWLFMYAVLQALPMLVVDATGIKHTQGVEYFLCTPPKFGVPWAREDAVRRNSGARVGDDAIVSLPADLDEHGVEGIYHRSHCWVAAERWSAADPALSFALHAQIRMDTPRISQLPLGARSSDVGVENPPHSSSHSGGGLGFRLASPEMKQVTSRDHGPRRQRPLSTNDPSKTFDAILAATASKG